VSGRFAPVPELYRDPTYRLQGSIWRPTGTGDRNRNSVPEYSAPIPVTGTGTGSGFGTGIGTGYRPGPSRLCWLSLMSVLSVLVAPTAAVGLSGTCLCGERIQ